MSDTALTTYLHYGTNAQRLAFTPSPPATGQPIYAWYETDTDTTWIYTTGWHQVSGSGGGVTASGTLTANNVILGNGTSVVKALGSLGTTTTVLHGNAGGAPSFATVVEADITLADNTTNDVSTSKHGLFPKLQSGVVSYLCGSHVYAPASTQTYSTTSTTYADMDATNLVVTFTVPASGNVLVKVTVYRDISSTAQFYNYGLRSGSSDVAASGCIATRGSEAGVATISMTGLTPGTSTTWKLSHAATGGATGRTLVQDGAITAGHYGPFIMEVWAA